MATQQSICVSHPAHDTLASIARGALPETTAHKLPSGPPRNKTALLAHFGGKAEYSNALAISKRHRRAHRAAEATLRRSGFFDGRVVNLSHFKTECKTLLDNLQAMPNGRPKTPEQLTLHVAQFAEQWFRMGQQTAAVETEPERTEPEIILPTQTPHEIQPGPPIPEARSNRGRAVDPASLGNQEFTIAAGTWLRMGKARLRQSTIDGYSQYIKQLKVYFGGMALHEIHHGHLSEYQVCRTENIGGLWFTPTEEQPLPWTATSGRSNTNHELNTLQQILKSAKLWAPIADHYKPLPPSGFKKPKVMTDDEKARFYQIANSRPQWALALWVATITNYTSASGVELRNLKLGDLVLDGPEPCIYVNAETAKCQNRGRQIELTPDAVAALRKCKDRANALGSFRDEHYLFPFYLQRNAYDVTRPATGAWLRRAWPDIRDAAGLPWLTPHCLRHQCLTELSELDTPAPIMRKIAGHLSPEMTDHYSHGRRKQQAVALNKLKTLATVITPQSGGSR